MDHFERFRGCYEDDFEREQGRWRRVVDEVVARYLECGVLEARRGAQAGARRRWWRRSGG